MTTVGTAQVVDWDRAALAARTDEVLEVYAEAMAVPRGLAAGRRSILTAHLDRTGLRAVAGLAGALGGTGGTGATSSTGSAGSTAAPAGQDPADRLVGIAYGHLGARGQWWHDQVRAALVAELGEAQAAEWLRAVFEVCELHVRPDAQGAGLGRALLDRLLERTDAPVALLTTPDAVQTRARGFYRAAGWVDLVRGLRFPGDPRSFAVLGLRLDGPW